MSTALRVVRAGDVVAVRRDEQTALARAAEMIAEQERAREEAYAEGRAAGLAEARSGLLAQQVAVSERAVSALGQVVALAERTHHEEVQATSRAVLAAALDIAEWVLRSELPASGRSLLSRLEAAAEALLPSLTTRVVVSAADEEAVRAWAVRRRGVEVLVDPALAPGDATYETDAGSVDVTLAAALRVAARTLGVDDTGTGAPGTGVSA